MNAHPEKIIDRLKLYGLYFLHYTQARPRSGQRTARALFLGEIKKQADSVLLTELVNRPGEGEASVIDRYLDIAFLAYRPGNGLPDSVPSSRYDVFSVFFCNPDGLQDLNADNVIRLPAGYRMKQYVDRPDAPHGELLRKLRRIGEDSGLIDTHLTQSFPKPDARLSTTRIRKLHQGLTQLIEKAKPDAGL
jgi:hypothetical protein